MGNATLDDALRAVSLAVPRTEALFATMGTDGVLVCCVIILFVLLALLERRAPRTPFPTMRLWPLVGAAFLSVMFLVQAGIGVLATWVECACLLDARFLGPWWGTLVGVIAVTFVDYWYHRAAHRYSWLWRHTHQFHHSASRVDILGFAYTHPLEHAVFALEGVLVLELLVRVQPLAVFLTNLFVVAVSMVQHWNVRTPPWMGYFIQRPESHCVHHQRNLHAFNYGNLPLWDILFGTFRNPKVFEAEVGFADGRGERVIDMLVFRDVHRGAVKERPATGR